MMHRCCTSHVGAQCTCGSLFPSQRNSLSLVFPMPNHHISFDESDMHPFASSSSSVDCTLSLGTPSTRLTTEDDEKKVRLDQCRSMSNFCWDIPQNNKTNAVTYGTASQQVPHKISRGSNSNGSSSNNLATNDPLLARRCANCDTTSTPLWRNGPRGPKSLCNACGIRFKKEERRATAANANSTVSATAAGGGMDYHQHYGYHHQSNNNSWVQTQKMPCLSAANEFRFIEDTDRDSDTGIPFLSWRLNVSDRPSLVHDFTR